MTIDIPKKVREFAGMAEALAGLVEIADKHNALVQFEAEHEGRIARLRADEAAIGERIAAGRATVEQASIEANEIDRKAREGAERHAGEAMRKADAILADAEAAKVKERRAESDQRKAEKKLEQIQATLSHLNAQAIDAHAIIAKAEAIKKAMG